MSEYVPSHDRDLLLQAAVDGELDAAGTLAFERSLRGDAALAADYERLIALRTAFRKILKTRASADLRARAELLVASLAAAKEAAPPRRAAQMGGWVPAAIAACFAFLLGSGLTSLVLPHPTPELTKGLVASHVRSVMSGQTTDVLSSDRHTVKPWFSTHSVVSPQVVDLAGIGFPLVGGRLDVVGATPVPTLVYHRRDHVISLTQVPDSVALVPTGQSDVEGLVVLSWKEGQATYVAISDAQTSEIETFAAAYRQATANPL